MENANSENTNLEKQSSSSENQKKSNSFMKNHIEKLQLSKINLLLTVFFAIMLMFLVAFIVFKANLKGEEQVMVPNVVGKELGQALLEMQEKELYQKIQFRYSDDPNEPFGTILSQSPEAGAIVKAGRRINIVVSRGAILNHVENYVGETYDNVRLKIQSMFAGSSSPLIILDEPSYKADSAPLGTVIAQNLPEGTPISTPVNLKLIVSKGADYETVKVPNFVGLSIEKVYKQMASSRLLLDFVSHKAEGTERAGTITKQQEFDTKVVRIYTHMTVDLALPTNADVKNVVGIFSKKITKYPFATEMKLESKIDGKKKILATFNHLGGNVSIPYEVEHGTELNLLVGGKSVASEYVE